MTQHAASIDAITTNTEDVSLEMTETRKLLTDTNTKASIIAPRKEYYRDYGPYISAISNLSIQYNMGVIAPALLLLDPRQTSKSSSAAYPRTDEIDAILKSSIFTGAIFGQCTMGFIGDIIGLDRAVVLTIFLTVLGIIGCTCAPWIGGCDNPELVYGILVCFRGILGVGVGGKYPLASAVRAESSEKSHSHEENSTHRAKDVASSFFWQTPGAILPYIISLFLLLSFGGDDETNHFLKTNWMYTVLVGIGAVPSVAVLILNWKQWKDKRGYQHKSIHPWHVLSMALRNKIYWQKLVGTGVSWALYDFVYYGTAFNQPEIIARFIGDHGLVQNSLQNAIVAMMGIPGVVCALMAIEPMGVKPLQGWGFLLIGGISFGLAVLNIMVDDWKWISMTLCGLLIFALNWGCNVSTYVIPMEIFPREVRSSFHGLSAGMGKIGALLGTYFFTQLNEISITLTYIICAIACVIGIWTTYRFVDPKCEEVFRRRTVKESRSEQCMAKNDVTECVG